MWSRLCINICPVFPSLDVHSLPLSPLPSVHSRAVNDWNRLSRHIVISESIGSFKRRLDESMDRDDRWDG